ncbi:MAG TPA: hypothetical protein VKY59_07745, partial [Spirillospora sp.]|nr:hypothetical protein [Spirillospora sp.]
QFYEARSKGVPNEDLPPRPQHWDILRAINPAALPGYNGLLINFWQVRDQQAEVLTLLLDLFSKTPNDVDNATEAWKHLDKVNGWGIKPIATGQQLYNPDQGKGQNRLKSDGLSIGNQDNFWLIEWLKAVGFYEAALTRLVLGGKDRKTFVVTPRELSYEANRKVMNAFHDRMNWAETSTRFDILAAIRYADTLLDYFTSEETTFARLMQLRNIQKKVVAGFHTAFYKDLGNAVATMNIAFIALPGWIVIRSREDVQIYRSLLEEIEAVTRQFDESHSDAFTLLQYLRDFVSGDDLEAFFRFTNAFPAYYMGMRERGKYAQQFSTGFIERLIMSTEPKLSPILDSEGFRNIAYAIRQSTITAQYRKAQGDRKYDVRYGLGQELSRKARYPEQFIAELSDFLHKYNAENAQVMETRPGPYRRSIQTSDIDEIVSLIDEFGSETVAKLLIAYGYARVPREDSLPQEEEEIAS